MICKKCGHDVDKYEVIYLPKGGFNTVPCCPCGEKLT